jgi:hypothetical protein
MFGDVCENFKKCIQDVLLGIQVEFTRFNSDINIATINDGRIIALVPDRGYYVYASADAEGNRRELRASYRAQIPQEAIIIDAHTWRAVPDIMEYLRAVLVPTIETN